MARRTIFAGPKRRAARYISGLPSLREFGHRAVQRLAHRHLWMALTLLAPLGALIRAVRATWAPEGDDATIVLRSREVLHGEFPLQGMRSTAGGGEAALANHHLGPLELYVLMPASILGSGWAVAVTCVLVAAVCSVAAVHWAHRIGGDPAVVVFGSGVLVLQAALGPEALFRPFNPYFGLLPIYFALVLLVAHLAGRSGMEWPLVLTTAIIAQANLAYAPIGIGIACVALAVTGYRELLGRRLSLRWCFSRLKSLRRNSRRRPRRTSRRSARRHPLRTLRRAIGSRHPSRGATLTLVFAVLVWAPVLVEPFRHDPGNLEQLLRAARSGDATQGLGSALRRLGLFAPTPGGFRSLGPDLVYLPTMTSLVLGALVIAALVASALPWGPARGQRLAVIPARAALCGAGLLVLTLASLPVEGLANHYLASVIPIVVFSWAALAWRVVLLLPQLSPRIPRLAIVRIAVPATAVAVFLTVGAKPPSFVGSDLGRGASDMVLEASTTIPRGSHVDVGGRGFLATLSTAPAVALQLERAGFQAHYLFAWPMSEDAERLVKAKAPASSVQVHLIGSDAPDRTPPAGARSLGTVTVSEKDSVAVYLLVPATP